MYIGIGLAPVLGAAALNGVGTLAGPVVVPLVGAALGVLALVLFLVGSSMGEPDR